MARMQGVALRTFTDFLDSIRRTEGQGDLAFRNIIFTRIDVRPCDFDGQCVRRKPESVNFLQSAKLLEDSITDGL